jgi:hypothetical protein
MVALPDTLELVPNTRVIYSGTLQGERCEHQFSY